MNFEEFMEACALSCVYVQYFSTYTTYVDGHEEPLYRAEVSIRLADEPDCFEVESRNFQELMPQIKKRLWEADRFCRRKVNGKSVLLGSEEWK